MTNSEIFLTTFNRIEKWMRQEYDNKTNKGFTEMVRELARRTDLSMHKYEDDLIQMAQLRNAIIHDQIAPDFIIAEPNEWAVKKMQEIEEKLLHPQKVIPLFEKTVTGFESDTLLSELLKIVAEKGYSQFPIYENGVCRGLITAHGLGIWLAKHAQNNVIKLDEVTASEVLNTDRKSQNYRFISTETTINETLNIFLNESIVEALLITKDRNPNGKLLGIVRPKDAFQNYYSE